MLERNSLTRCVSLGGIKSSGGFGLLWLLWGGAFRGEETVLGGTMSKNVDVFFGGKKTIQSTLYIYIYIKHKHALKAMRLKTKAKTHTHTYIYIYESL